MSAGNIRIVVNGESREVPEGTGLLALLEQLNEPHGAAVVERNNRYVDKKDLATVVLEDGDKIEVILPAFGG